MSVPLFSGHIFIPGIPPFRKVPLWFVWFLGNWNSKMNMVFGFIVQLYYFSNLLHYSLPQFLHLGMETVSWGGLSKFYTESASLRPWLGVEALPTVQLELSAVH